MKSAMQGERYAFGPFELDPEAGTLSKGKDPVAVGHRAFLLLTAFTRHCGEVLSKSELMDAAWQGLAVEEGNLTVQIAALRRILGKGQDGREWIVTVPRVGYRFIGSVERIDRLGAATPLPLPSKPSLAVLPFTNLSDDAGQESFVDGLTDDLITDLSRHAGLFVIARHSVFAYKGRSSDVRTIGQQLGVRYLLEGSARTIGTQVRINVQLTDAIVGETIWADRFDRAFDDIFSIQDEVVGKIVEALIGRLGAPPPRKRPKNPEAHTLCVRAKPLIDESPQTAREATVLLNRAVRLDPAYAEAIRWLAMSHWMAWLHWGEPIDANRALAVSLAERAVELDPSDAGCHWVLGNILTYEKRYEEADAALTTALKLDPNNADAWADLSDISILAGRVTEGLEQIEKAFRLNPYPAPWYHWNLGQAQYAVRDYEAAVATLRREQTYRTSSRRFLAASLAQLGLLEEAREEVALFLISNPHFTIRHWVETQPIRDDATRDHFVEGFRKAGLPE
jgi:TolB-like protein